MQYKKKIKIISILAKKKNDNMLDGHKDLEKSEKKYEKTLKLKS